MKSRRTFLGYTAGLAAIPLLDLTGAPTARAAGEVKISEDDPLAVAFGYKHDANDVDIARFPKRAAPANDMFPAGEDQFCDNCGQYVATEEGWGTCVILPGKLVAAKGWCNVWVPIT